MKLPFKIDLSNKVAVVTGGGGVLCGDFAKAKACFEEMKEAHKDYLPQFFKEQN